MPAINQLNKVIWYLQNMAKGSFKKITNY